MMIFAGLTVVPQASQQFSRLILRGHNGAAIAVRAKIFRRVETKASHFTKRPCPFFAIRSAVRLARVFDHWHMMLARDPQDRVHIAWLPVKMNRDQSLCARSYG